MGVALTVDSTGGSEVYTTSARVAREVNTSGLSAQALTEVIVAVQRKCDSVLEEDYAVPFASGSVPVELEEISTDLSIARVQRSTRTARQGPNAENPTWVGIEEKALMWLKDIATGKTEMHSSAGAIIQRLMEEYAISIVAAATPVANHTIVTDSDDADVREYRIVARVTVTSGTPSGWVKVKGETDDGQQITEPLYFPGARDLDCRLPFYHVTGLDASGLTGGTGTQIALLAVQSRGKTYTGEVA